VVELSTWVPFVESPEEVVRKMLQLAQIKPGELVCDLGSGDGRIVISAAKDFGARAIGYELREDLVRRAREKISAMNLDKMARIVNADLLTADLSQVDVVTIYLNTTANERLRPKLEKELKSGARVVSHDFSLNTWRPVEVSTMEPAGHTIYLYKSPWSFENRK
jgi:tRNA A58 N-methylase Trm61